MQIRMRFLQVLTNNRVIMTNAMSLMGTLVITSGLGFAFWWLIARKFELTEAGLASASISAMYLLGTIGMMGMGTLLIGELSRAPSMEVPLITTALLVSGTGSAVLGIGFALVAPLFSAEFILLNSSWMTTLIFSIGVSVTSMALVLDQALLGLLMGNWQLWRNAVFALSKLLLLVPAGYYFGAMGAMGIYTIWLAGNILSFLFLFWFLGSKRITRASQRLQWGVFWKMRSIAAAHHILNLSLQAAQYTMPVIVTVLLTPKVNAGFYVTWLIVTSFFVIPSALTQTLYAVSAADVSVLAQKIRFTLRMSFLGVISGGLFIFLLARFILNFFNPSYAITATESLRILLLAALPIVIRVHYVAIHQIRRQIKQAAMKFLAMAVLELVLATTGGIIGGLVGLSIGWVLAIYVEGMLMSSTVYRVAYRANDSTGIVKTTLAEEL